MIYDDNPAGIVYTLSGDTATPSVTFAPGAADLWTEGDMLYVPLTQTGELVALKVE